MSGAVYLRGNVVLEPLVDRWYAAPFLIAPTTASLFLAGKYIPILRSYVESPEMHYAASQNPEMAGGPFVAYPPSRVPDVQRLLDDTLRTQAWKFELAEAIRQATAMLEPAAGESLEAKYASLPEVLRGRVELVYDVHNHASLRFIEPLFYRGLPWRRSQSLALYPTHGDERPFALSTPKLDAADELLVERPFDDEGVRALCALRERPRPVGELVEMLGLPGDDALVVLTTDEPPAPVARYVERAPRVRYLGHACVLVECAGGSVLFDPFVGNANPAGIARYAFSDLPPSIDAFFVTHGHLDHCVPETLLQLRHKTRTGVVPRSGIGHLADPSLRLVCESMGFDDVRELGEFETFRVNDHLRVTGLPFFGEHADLQIGAKSAYLVEASGKKIVVAADSNVLTPELYAHLAAEIGEIDVLFIGMECVGAPASWTYGPLFARPLPRKLDQSRRINGSDASRAMHIVEALKPKRVFLYAMGQEPWMSHVMGLNYAPDSPQLVEADAFVRACQARGTPCERLYGRAELSL